MNIKENQTLKIYLFTLKIYNSLGRTHLSLVLRSY